jgi:phage host-nuclease inhibitor protein Gam
MTVPKAEVTMYVHSAQEFVKKIISSSAGIWFKQFDTSVLALGTHSTFSRASINDRITDQSNVVDFKVGTTSIKEASSYKRSDLNNDGKVNIVDFSMLLYYWHKKPPVTSKADINKDGIVDIIDLSIMLYDWTG